MPINLCFTNMLENFFFNLIFLCIDDANKNELTLEFLYLIFSTSYIFSPDFFLKSKERYYIEKLEKSRNQTKFASDRIKIPPFMN